MLTPIRAALATMSAAEKKLEKLINKEDTPLKLGYTMPGEFEPHTGKIFCQLERSSAR